MNWISVNSHLPDAGKHVVKTKRTHYPVNEGSEQVIEATLSVTIDDKGKVTKTWNCRNQVVTHWLDQEANEW